MCFYSVGGLGIQISAASCCDLKKNIHAEPYHSFCAAASHEHQLFQQDISIRFARSQERPPQIAGRKIYSQQKAELYAAEDGSLQLICLGQDERSALQWTLRIDSEFSQFNYFLSPHTAETADPHLLAFNRFLFQHTFISHHGLIIHAAGGAIQGKGMVFAAPSGTGKSTLSHLLLPFSQHHLFSEERLVLRPVDDRWHVWGTPWQGSGSIARNGHAPLAAVVFLSQAKETKITPLAPSVSLHRLLEVVSIPWYSRAWTERGLAACEALIKAVPMFELAFRPDQTAVQAVGQLAVSLD